MEELRLTKCNLGDAMLALERVEAYSRNRDQGIVKVLRTERPLKSATQKKLVDAIEATFITLEKVLYVRTTDHSLASRAEAARGPRAMWRRF